MSRSARSLALGLVVALTCPCFAQAAPGSGGRGGPAKPNRPLCSKKRTKKCVRVPASAVRSGRQGQQGGPTDLVPDAPIAGGLGGAGFNREESAIAWAQGKRGNTAYAWWCERFVENAFNTQGQFASAWIAAQRLGLHDGWAPRGALVFFRPHASNKSYGHVGISLGGTKMISALSSVQETDINASAYWRSLYAGWARAPNGWSGRDIVPTPPVDLPVDPPRPDSQTTTPTTTTVPPPVNRQGVVSYDQMKPGAPHHSFFNQAWQPFVAQSNTITYAGATVGTQGQPAGEATPFQLTLRICTNQPDAGGNCNVLTSRSAQIVNYGNSAADFGDTAVTKGSTYWLQWFQPPPANGNTWVTYWFGGGAAIGSSDVMQAIVSGYDR